MYEIDGQGLNFDDVYKIARLGTEIKLSPQARKRMEKSRGWVEKIAKEDEAVYGINTGFGIFANERISKEDIARLNRNLILSHAVATGERLADEVVRAAMLIRANTLAAGYSGVRPVLVDRLIEMLNKGVTPEIPSQGSLGSSGDLAPLAHLALVLTRGEQDKDEESGWAYFKGERMSGKAAMDKAGIERLQLEAKEGLGLTNGATFSAGMAALALHQAQTLMNTADTALAMSLEALMGASAAFDERLHEARKHFGQQQSAANVRALTAGSELLDQSERVQDAYSLRCGPQVHGPVWDTLRYIGEMVSAELNAATDNPLLFGPGEAISGGNFHGEPVGLAMDYLKIGLSEAAAISERRTYHLTDGKMNNGLPAMLVDKPEEAGLHSGVMMAQYTAASLVLENQNLAAPDSVHSLPTSGGQEDHNANAMTAARNAMKVVDNCMHVLAIELYCAARALDLRLRERGEVKMGKGVRQAYEAIRERVPYRGEDSWWGPEIETVKEMVVERLFLDLMRKHVD